MPDWRHPAHGNAPAGGPPPPPGRRRNPWLIALFAVLGAFVALAVLGGILSSVQGNQATADPTATVTTTTSASPRAPGPTVTETRSTTRKATATATRTATVTATVTATRTRTAPAAEKPAPATSAREGRVHYENCAAAKRDGAAPVRRGDPGYGRHLDRDGDGIACEWS
ncbi:excalibur calcium-binding domain-containing protein [Streptomyces sp. NPDC005438]|uniref:excalibur calcium-binding domain-containing protein n=1 Tax=Streptomyces sp. NPDC005438 TaxID=3156880 RepID=UPI0033B7DED7